MKLMLFTGSWCIPCQQMKPIVKEVAEERGIGLKVVDVEAETEAANAYMVRGVPTLIKFDDDGGEVGRKIGGLTKEQIEEFLSEIY